MGGPLDALLGILLVPPRNTQVADLVVWSHSGGRLKSYNFGVPFLVGALFARIFNNLGGPSFQSGLVCPTETTAPQVYPIMAAVRVSTT